MARSLRSRRSTLRPRAVPLYSLRVVRGIAATPLSEQAGDRLRGSARRFPAMHSMRQRRPRTLWLQGSSAAAREDDAETAPIVVSGRKGLYEHGHSGGPAVPVSNRNQHLNMVPRICTRRQGSCQASAEHLEQRAEPPPLRNRPPWSARRDGIAHSASRRAAQFSMRGNVMLAPFLGLLPAPLLLERRLRTIWVKGGKGAEATRPNAVTLP